MVPDKSVPLYFEVSSQQSSCRLSWGSQFTMSGNFQKSKIFFCLVRHIEEQSINSLDDSRMSDTFTNLLLSLNRI